MSIVFVWEEQYSVGVPELDKQHRFLFDLGNDIQKFDKADVRKHVMELYKYATSHFNSEEQHMRQIGYPDLKNHHQLHETFITNLNTMTDNQGENLLKEVKRFLQNWLIDHILNEDKQYFEYVKNKKES